MVFIENMIDLNEKNMVDLNEKTILVTGGAGFIGSNFIEYVDKNFKNVKICNLDKLGIGSRNDEILQIVEPFNMIPYGYCETVNDNYYQILILDLCEIIFTWGKFDYIFHFAAESHVDRSISGPSPFIENNVMGMVSLLEWVRQYQPQAKVVNISTDEVFSHLVDKTQASFTEISRFAPRSPYAASKASADLIANSYVTTYGLDIITTHCCNNFGKHQADEKFIPTVIRNMVQGNPIPVYGTGENIREWIHVDDHNKSLLEIAEFGKSGWRYNIGSGIEKSNLEMILDISEILGINPLIEFVEDRKGHDFRYAIESIHYKRNFDLKSHRDALKETVEFYKDKYTK